MTVKLLMHFTGFIRNSDKVCAVYILLLEQSSSAIHDKLFQGCYETLLEKTRVQIYEMHSSSITKLKFTKIVDL